MTSRLDPQSLAYARSVHPATGTALELDALLAPVERAALSLRHCDTCDGTGHEVAYAPDGRSIVRRNEYGDPIPCPEPLCTSGYIHEEPPC